MSFDRSRRLSALTGLALVAGCGFAPAFGTDGAATAIRNAVTVEAPDDAAGFALRSRIADRLGAPMSARYTLSVTMATTAAAGAITSEGDTTRFQIIGTADWALADLAGRIVSSGRAESFASYSATGSTVATQAAATDARNRLSVALADQIVSDLILAAPAGP